MVDVVDQRVRVADQRRAEQRKTEESRKRADRARRRAQAREEAMSVPLGSTLATGSDASSSPYQQQEL